MCATEFGLIGHPLGHSLSPFIHHGIMGAAGLEGSYRLFDIPAECLAETIRRLSADLAGFNCTIPYKEAIIPFLGGLDETAARIRSVNTVADRKGYNTDFAAFRQACPLHKGSLVLLLGAGGVSRTMAYAAADAGCHLYLVARRPEQADALVAAVRCHYPKAVLQSCATLSEWRIMAGQLAAERGGWIVLNGTPLGMWPDLSGLPLPKDDLVHVQRVYDTIYNPVATRLVLAARSRGIPADGGQGMLFHQALAAQKIWHPDVVFEPVLMRRVQRDLTQAIMKQSPVTILLTGFMGSGKTTVGRQLAKKLDLPFLDLDTSIEKQAGRSIPEIFATEGEAYFRDLERSVLRQSLDRRQSQVMATGGGALLGDGVDLLRKVYPVLIILLDVSLPVALQRLGRGEGRPMLAGQDGQAWEKLYQQRQPRYHELADLVVDADSCPGQIARAISQHLGLEENQ